MAEMGEPIVVQTPLGPVEYFERESRGGPSRGTILAIHGAMGGYDQSDILARVIGPKGYRYIAVSRPGYLGTPLKNRETPEAQADLLAALVDELGIADVILFAISGGGYSALHFALRHAQKCRGMVLCSTTGGRNNVPIPFMFSVLQVASRLPFFSGLMRRRIEKNLEASLKRSVSHQDIFDSMVSDQKIMSQFKELSLSTMNHMAKRIPGTLNDIQVTQRTEYPLGEISVPVLVVHGTDDSVVPYHEHGKRLAEEIPGARLCLADRGEHVAIFTHNHEIRTTIEDFLGNIVS